MKTTKLFAIALIAFAPVAALAQFKTAVNDSDGRNMAVRKEKGQPATGSQFITENFMPAKLSGDNAIKLLRYNAYTDHFESKGADGVTSQLDKDKETLITFTGESKKYIFAEYTDNKEEKVSGYLNLISDNNKIKIYGREKVIMEKEVFPNSSYDTYKPANYKKNKVSYLISVNNGPIVAMPSNKKDFSKLFGPREKEVLEYIKSNKIDLDDEKEIAQLATYIGTII